MTCADYTVLSKAERLARLAALPGMQSLGRSGRAVMLAISWWEANTLVQIQPKKVGPLDFGACPPKFRPPCTLDNFTGKQAELAKMIVNPTILETSVGQYAIEVGLIKIQPDGRPKRMEGMPDGRSNAVVEQAIINKDVRALQQFSVSTWQNFLGVGYRLRIPAGTTLEQKIYAERKSKPTKADVIVTPSELYNVDSLEAWYRSASYDEDAAISLALHSQGIAFSTLASEGGIYDDQAVINRLMYQAGNTKSAQKYWANIKSTAYSLYQQYK